MKRALYIGGGLVAAAGLLWWLHRRSSAGTILTTAANVIPIHGRTGNQANTTPTAPIHGQH